MKSRNIAGMIFISLLLLSCGKTGVESNIKKDDKVVSLREYNTLKENTLPKRRVVIGKVKNYSRFGTQRTDITTKDILASEFRFCYRRISLF